MRCSPSVDNPALADFDKWLRSTIGHLSNCVLTEVQWLQASLPVIMGGLGMKTLSSLALPAYFASAASTSSLQETILDATTCSIDEVFA